MPNVGQGIAQGADRILDAVMLMKRMEQQDKNRGASRINALQTQAGPNVYTGDVLPTGGSVPTQSGGASALMPRAQLVANAAEGAPFDPSGVDQSFDPGSFDVNAALQAKQVIGQRRSATSGAMKQAKKMFAKVFKNLAAEPRIERDLRFAVEEAKTLSAMLNQKKEQAQFNPNVQPPSDGEIRMMQGKMNKVAELKELLKQNKGETEELYGHLTTKFGIDPANMDEFSLSQLGLKMDPELLQELGIVNPGVPGEGQARVFPAFGAQRGVGQFQDIQMSPAAALQQRAALPGAR